MSVEIPESSAVIPLLAGLIGKDLTVQIDQPVPDPAAIVKHLAVFVGDDDEPMMLAGGDSAFAHLSGAALAMIPKGRAEDAISKAILDEDLMENYWEIINVLTRAVNDAGGAHVRFVPGTVPDLDALPEPRDGTCFGIGIDGYGDGKLAFWRF